MRARRHLVTESDAGREIWPAFTDVMSTMALILFVLVLLAYVKNLISARQVDAFQRRITASETRLRGVDADLRRTSAEVDAAKAALRASEDRLHAQEGVIAESNRQLGELEGRLQSIAVLRVDVLNKLKQAIETELGPTGSTGAPLVTIGDSGNIVINESLVFDSGSAAVKPQAKPLIDGLAKALGRLLADDAVRENVDAVVIQGHTDERGSAGYNWDLSARRATAVLERLFEANPALADTYGRYFAASAYSKYRPLDPQKGESAYSQNRRIEISVIPKDGNVRRVIDEYMKGIDPALAPAPAPAPAPSPVTSPPR